MIAIDAGQLADDTPQLASEIDRAFEEFLTLMRQKLSDNKPLFSP
jgi:hypothetical protein